MKELSDVGQVVVGGQRLEIGIDDTEGDLKRHGGNPGIVVRLCGGQELFRGTWDEMRELSRIVNVVVDIAEFG